MKRFLFSSLASLALYLAPKAALAKTITVTPTDSYDVIEAAEPGDTVVIQPGTYKFRVYLDKDATASAPIVIQAADPSDPPVWDLSDVLVEDAPGSYGGGDKGRGCWQVIGSHYHVSGIVFRGCRNAGMNSAGIRTNGSHDLTVEDVLFDQNDNGFTGHGEDTTVSFCEFSGNGNPSASAPTHNIYVYGGTFALRYSYLHDPVQGQNFHIRARDSVLEYNWIARAKSYEGDLMTSDFDDPPVQKMLFRGNVVLGNPNPNNGYQVIALFNDNGTPGNTMDLTAVWNTFVIQASSNPRIVHVLNDSMDAATVTFSNNVIAGTTRPYEVENEANTNWMVAGSHNWLVTGADPKLLTGTVSGASPGFKGAPDFTLATGSACIGAADPAAPDAPSEEYFKDEVLARKFRHRLTTLDIGAFESTTVGNGFGPYDDPTSPTGSGGGGSGGGGPSSSSAASGGGGGQSTGQGGSGGSGGVDSGGSGGNDHNHCGCRAVGSAPGGAALAPIAALAAIALGLRRRRRAVARSAFLFSSSLALAGAGCAAGDQPSSAGTGTAGGTGGAGATGGMSSSTGATGGAGATGGMSSSTGATGGTGGGGGTGGAGGVGPCGAPMCTGDVEWVNRYGPAAGQQFSYGLGVDGTGLATIAGAFNGTLDLGQMQLATAGGIDMFWAKVNPAGVTVAAKRFGGAGNDVAYGAAADRKGNTAYYGVFSGTLDFGNGPLAANNFRMFLARLGPDGTAAWSKAFGDMVNASNQTAAFDPDGNVVYGTGYFGDIDFGAGPVTGGSSSFTITKFDVAGGALWSKKYATYMATSVAVDGDGGILVSGGGDVANPPDLGCGDPGSYRVIGRLDPNGNCVWHKGVSGPAIDFIAAEGDRFALLARFNNSGTIGSDTIAAPGGKRFVALYDTAGTLIGSFIIADDTVNLEALAVDTHGGVVFKGTMTNGTADFDGHVLTGNSFLARLGPDAKWLWGKGLSGDASFPTFVGVAPLGHVFLYGRADGPLDFGTGVLAGGMVPNEDIVLARFKP